jgi:FAD/FMN-containing dehydrogenase
MQDLSVTTTEGSFATVSSEAIRELGQRLGGGILTSADDEYESARRVWNALVDRMPALIARCNRTEDVIEVVRFARRHELLLSIRSGGHNIWGTAVCDGGVVIDLSAMKTISVDPAARRAFAGPGVRWQELDRETQAHGLATPGGQHSEVGIAGFTLGGGLGWLTRKYGLAADNLRSAEIVTADGQRLQASATENPDLFWAIRGGGGNFGIVTRFEFELYPVGPVVLCGMALHPLERAGEVLRFLRDFSRDTPEDLHTTAVLMAVPGGGPRAVALVVLYDGPIDAGEEAVRVLRAFGPPLQDMIGPMRYAMFQSMMDHTAPAGRCYLDRSRFMTTVDDRAIDIVVKHFDDAPSPPCTVFLHRLGGAMSRVRTEDTAFFPRDAQFCLVTSSSWEDPEHAEKHIEWTRALLTEVEPYTMGASYLNDLGRAEDEGEAAIRAAFGTNYPRLSALKAKYDPTNFFRHNQNVKPAP